MYGVFTELCGVNNVLGGRMRRRTCVHSPSPGCPQDHEIPLLQSARRLLSSTIQLSRQCHNHCTHEPRVLSPDAEAQDILREPLHYVWSIQDVLRLSVVSNPLHDGCLARVCTSSNEDSELEVWLVCGNGVFVSHLVGFGRNCCSNGWAGNWQEGAQDGPSKTEDHTVITISRSGVDCKCHPIPEMQFTSPSAIR